MNDTVKSWLIGLGSGVISGAAASIASTGTIILSDLKNFNLKNALINLGISILAGGIVGTCIFLKGKPLPWTKSNEAS